MQEKKMILFGDNVDTIIFWNELLDNDENKNKIDFLSFAPISMADLYDAIEKVVKFKPNIFVFSYPDSDPFGREVQKKIFQLFKEIEMKYFKERDSISKLFQTWGIKTA